MDTPIRREGTINLFDTHFGLWENPKVRLNGVFWDEMMHVFYALRGHLYRRGWTLRKDADVHQCIRDGHWLGRKSDLEAVLECAGRTIKVEFFQNVANVKNRNGGRYDFDKFEKMPCVIRRKCWAEMNALAKWALSIGYRFDAKMNTRNVVVDSSKPIELSILRAMSTRVDYGTGPLDFFNRSWGADRFRRGDDGWPTEQEIQRSNAKDRDGNIMRNGDVRFFYHWDKRLSVGRVFTSINNMWEVWSLDCRTHLSKQASFELFSCTDPSELPRRKPLTNEEQIRRLRSELEKATKISSWKRVATLGRVLDRMTGRAASAA